jgi:hypothetical protein
MSISIWAVLAALGLLLGALARPLAVTPLARTPTPAFAVPVLPDPTPEHEVTLAPRGTEAPPTPARTFEAFPQRFAPDASVVPEIAD